MHMAESLDTLMIATITTEPKQAFLGWVVYWVVCLYIAAWFKETFGERPKPTRTTDPPFKVPPIPPPPADSGQSMDMRVPTDQLYRCVTQVNRLAKERLPGWPYQVALTLFAPQLAALRGEFDRLLITAVPPQTVVTLAAYGHYSAYYDDRIRGMERILAQLSDQFSAGLPAACAMEEPDRIRRAVNGIIRNCRWIYAWGADRQHYRGPFDSGSERPLGPREADHIFRQVETLVADLKRKLADPAQTGSLLFRAEFYFPPKEEVDRPVLAVLSAPQRNQPMV